jgi:membrane-bound lytic murein transglycosylase B
VISRPAEAKPWYQYRPLFVTEGRIQGGLEFWNANQELLAGVERELGVPAQIIVAIIGVETRYGTYTGRYPVLDALTTLGFGYPKRGDFFRSELEQFLLLSREENIDPLTTKGSYAGAMGKPQFIASSYRRYAVDFDQDGRRDLWNSTPDVVGSVANYFVRHGWRPGDPVATPARGVERSHRRFVEAGNKPSIPIGELAASGIGGAEALPRDSLASLIPLETKDGHEYWIGLHNFYVITRYNHSNLYAMAVFQLSEAIQARRNAETGHDRPR